MSKSYTFMEAFGVVWDDVADHVLQRPTPMEVLTYAIKDITNDELRNTRQDDEDVYEAYLIVRDFHGLNRPDR